MRSVDIRLYGALNDFVPAGRRQRSLTWAVFGTPAVKDVLEAVGVPHPEIGLILVDGEPSGFALRLKGGERIAAYPADSRWALEQPGSVAPPPLEEPRFLLDGHLAALASTLRLYGIDAELPIGADDATLAKRSRSGDRILLTRDLGLLKRSEVRRGAFIRATQPALQVEEVVRRFHLLGKLAPLTRCSVCNVPLRAASGEEVDARVPPAVRRRVSSFRACPRCERVYWEGSHPPRIRARLEALRRAVELGSERP